MYIYLEEAVVKGIEAQKAGELRAAERYYHAAIEMAPDHAHANHNLGVIALDKAGPSTALGFFEKALRKSPGVSQYWLSYIDALVHLELFDEAQAALDAIRPKLSPAPDVEAAFSALQQRIDAAKCDASPLSQKPVEDRRRSAADRLKDARKLEKAGQTAAAIEAYQAIIARFPKNKKAAQALSRLATAAVRPAVVPRDAIGQLNALLQAAQYTEARALAEKLLKVHPDDASLLNAKGICALRTGRVSHALKEFNLALNSDPDRADIHVNMAEARRASGDLDGAIDSYRQALFINPKNAAALKDLGVCFMLQNDCGRAVDCFLDAIDVTGGTDALYEVMGLALARLAFSAHVPRLEPVFVEILRSQRFARPVDISFSAISLLMADDSLAPVISKVASGDFDLQPSIERLSRSDLLIALMKATHLTDLRLETCLRQIRQAFLLAQDKVEATEPVVRFCEALAVQCDNNEYIYCVSPTEQDALATFKDRLSTLLAKGGAADVLSLCLLAMYQPLNELDGVDEALLKQKLPDLWRRQVAEVKRRKELLTTIETVGQIAEDTSSRVRSQYEVNPYPRWITCKLPATGSRFDAFLAERSITLADPIIAKKQAPDVLIAGCGTGQTTLETHASLKVGSITAIDLSLASIAYGKYKAESLGMADVDFRQCDILDVAKLGQTFDYIECGGVLHHMADPLAGWRALASVLRPGGVMKIALYSEIARKSVVAAREEIAQLGIPAEAEAMRAFRQKIIETDPPNLRDLRIFGDFFSMSTFRDLLFHVQEHRFDLPEIGTCIDTLGLTFCGFEDLLLVQQFRSSPMFGGDVLDLAAWQKFEEAHPNSFASMYQFWCQKPI